VVVLGAAGVVAWSLAEAAASDRRAADQAERSNALRVRARAVTEVLREAMPNADPLHPELSNVIGDGLDRLYLRLETGVYATEPDVDQAVRRIWGQVYTGLGTGKASSRAQYAEVSLRNGLVRLRREHGPEHPEIAESMHELAALMLVRKRPEEALDLATRSLEMRRKLLGGDAVALADSHALLARIYNALREPGASLDHARTALASYRRLPERQADAPMGSMLALEARAFLDVRRAAAAEAPLRESLLRRLRALPPEDPDLLASLGDAALFAQLLPGSPLSVDIAACWGPAASAQRLRDDIPVLASPDRAGSEAPVRRSQALTRLSRFQELLLGPDDPAIVRTLMALSRAAHVEGDLRAKADASLHAADILTRRYGPDDSSVLVCLEEAAVVLAFDGDAARAADLGERALRIRQRTPPEARDPILEGGALRYQAWFLTLAGRYREGADYWERAGATLRSVVGPEHHAVALTRAGLAMCLAEEGRLEEADRVSAEALESGLKNPATTVGDQTANLRLARGLVLARLGRAEEAREQLLAAWDAFLGVHAPPRYPWRTLCARSLAECARRLNLPDEAARWDLALGQPPPAPESP
jgi:tetratricopeptide (TPR) repeat protein